MQKNISAPNIIHSTSTLYLGDLMLSASSRNRSSNITVGLHSVVKLLANVTKFDFI